MSELFKNLESNNPALVEESKNELIKSLCQTKENWLVYGMMEYFATQNSAKIVEILVKAPLSHDTYIFDKLSEWINTSDKRNQAFKLFSLIVQKHPSWLYRVVNHRLFREMLNIIKSERNINTTLHGIFCIVILLPIIPALMNDYLQDLFTIFLFLAKWKATNSPELMGNQPVYLQNGIERLFQRLYGMYPCNFMAYLRDHMNENTMKIIDPLIKNTRVHPMLLFSNVELEKNQARWKEMEPHDIVQECEKFALDISVRSEECDQEHNETPWYGRVGAPNQILANDRFKNLFTPIQSTTELKKEQKVRGSNKWDNIWSPSSAVLATPPPTNTMAITHTPTLNMSQNYNIQSIPGSAQYTSSGASPPEAAVEATPETTPLREFVKPHRPFPASSNAARTIWGGNTSQPSSPLKRDDHFRYDVVTNITSDKFLSMINDRNEEKRSTGQTATYNDIEIQNPLSDNNDADSSKEDEEVTEINKLEMNKMTESQPNTDKDIRSRSNLMKYHDMKSIEEFDQLNDEFSFNIHVFEQKSKKLANNTCIAAANEREKKTAIGGQQVDNSNIGKRTTQETQTDITMPIASGGLLDQYVETTIKRNAIHEPNTRADMELQLLYLQLQYERYRREVYAGRNRRLLGRSRDNATLKTDIEKLKSQLENLSREHSALIKNLNEAKLAQNTIEHKLSTECNALREELQVHVEQKKKLQQNIKSWDRQLAEEIEEKNKYAGKLEAAQAEIFDLKNLLRQCQYQADVGAKYKEELQRLQSREVLMGEIKLKCGEKLIELENLRGRENEISNMKSAYMEEVKELKTELAMKSSQLDATKERVQSFESQLSQQKSVIADLKRFVKTTKEEYEEKLKAVEEKYAAQKAIIFRMEESILDPSKHRSNVNSEPDKTDTVGSLDHASPLSMSLASSEGMSWSLRSVNEIKNLSHLLDNNTATVFSPSSFNGAGGGGGGEASSSNRVSDDIPVPSSSHSQFYSS